MPELRQMLNGRNLGGDSPMSSYHLLCEPFITPTPIVWPISLYNALCVLPRDQRMELDWERTIQQLRSLP